MWIHHASSPRDLGEPDGAPTQVPNYSSRMLWAIWAFTAASAVFLGLRVYCKVLRRRPLWWDDYFLIASWLTILVSSAMLSTATKYGLGMHWEDMDYTKIPNINLLSYPAGFCTILGTAWSKTSFAITILRLPSGRWTKWFIWFIIVSVNVVLGFTAATMFVSCWPVAKTWYPEIEGTCWPHQIVQNYQTFASAYSGTLDIVLVFLPWKIVSQTSLDKTEKLGALAAMSMGVFSGIISFLKIISLDDISDSSSTTVDIKIFGTAEPAVTIIAASIPMLRALLRKNVPTLSQSMQAVQFSNIPEPSSCHSPTFQNRFVVSQPMASKTRPRVPSECSSNGTKPIFRSSTG